MIGSQEVRETGEIEETRYFPVHRGLRLAPYAAIALASIQILPWDWKAMLRIGDMRGSPAQASWLALGLANLVAAYLLFVVWFFMRRYADRYLALDSESIRYGSNGRETAYPFSSLKGIRFQIGRRRRWALALEFAQGGARLSPVFEHPEELLAAFFRRIGKPLFGPEKIRREFLWRVKRTEILRRSFGRNWWKTALISAAAGWFGKMLADASPATDYRINLWLSFNLLLPVLAEILIHRILMRKWERRFRAADSLDVSLPPGYAAAVNRRVILGAVLAYLSAYFFFLSDLMLNS